MNETTTSAWTESRIARAVWQTLREDLFRPAWAFRPLLPLRPERVARHPRLDRIGVRWLPHATVVAFALFVALLDASTYQSWSSSGLVTLGMALVQTAPLLVALLRPVGAWWLSLAITALISLSWTWPGPGVLAHLGVMVLVVLRSRPLVAFEMWLISVVVLGGLHSLSPDAFDGSGVPMAVFAAFTLAIAVAARGWSVARGEVAEQETLVADVRGQHTLLEERARIARELHDVVAHHMSVIAIQAEAAPYRVSDPPEELTKSFSTIRQSAVEALAELRRVLGVLRFESPDDTGMPDAPQPDLSRLDELVDGVRAVGLSVEIARTGAQRPLPQGVELSAFRIIQEALSNALRHAPGSQVRVEVAYVLTGVGLRIVNTPPTGKVQPSPGMGHGVMGMRERASMLGGEVTAEPTPDGGFEVAAFLPAEQLTDQRANPAVDRTADRAAHPAADQSAGQPAGRRGAEGDLV
ncbi:histidine kinase [Streptomyces sp. NPDC004647]|uniref:sensor histidine kinase n=1 Tax=Streptomyces sp. NPDC004647 TaxID=3154671 RepID=UPI0033BF58F4